MRVRDRAVHTTLRTADGDFETAAFKGLFHLDRQPMRSRELAESLNADPSTVSRHVSQLVDLGLVRREADPDDGRATLLVVTDAGRARVESMRAMRRTAMDQAMSDWTDDELHTLVRLLGRFVDAAEIVMAPQCAKPTSSPTDFVKGQQ
ncbi:MarR family transcriptional regulator [Gordonia sp. CPCC 205515]|uniref:MarR family winged helix-turn-helix transcriptional regulator n=1 Tax=Gordonia sp. CPCC 205515 TaxID=3140791 RepID=UPI003AF3C2DC